MSNTPLTSLTCLLCSHPLTQQIPIVPHILELYCPHCLHPPSQFPQCCLTLDNKYNKYHYFVDIPNCNYKIAGDETKTTVYNFDIFDIYKTILIYPQINTILQLPPLPYDHQLLPAIQRALNLLSFA